MVGGGAREHTLAWKLAQSPRVSEMYVAPGNAGTARLAHNLDIAATDIDALATFARDNRVDLTVVGPEAPLADGIADRFSEMGLAIFGASRLATEIESSKMFAKELMRKYRIPCAGSVCFSDYEEAADYLGTRQGPVVVKADGLAAGKGVVVAESLDIARNALHDFMRSKTLGAAGEKVIIEECLSGRELSAFAFTDGRTVVPMAPACDYKRAYDGDDGPNTGGMGSYSPPRFFTPELDTFIRLSIMEPTVRAMEREGRPYRGVLYGGLMITGDGPRVLEFNARFGDPETQVILPRLKTDLVDIMLAVIDGRLDRSRIEWSKEACVGVVMASGGYPAAFKTGFPITGLDELDSDVLVFHAGTKSDQASGCVLTSGGRVLTVVATGHDLSQARDKVYDNIARIHFEGNHYRHDIAAFNGQGE